MSKWIEDSDPWGALDFLLSLRRGTKSQDPRDILYSLLGVAGLTGMQDVEPDYGLSWEEVYTSITRNLIHKKNNLDLLGSAFDRSDSSTSLPTWVSDWRVERCYLHLPNPKFGEPRQYCASGSSVAQILLLDDATKLGLQGLLCNKVYRIGLFKAEITEFIDRNHLKSEESLFGYYFNNFMTSGGLLGFGPGKVAIGDSVFVLLGGSVPYLLRQACDENEYSLVGECYVEGLMKGEALLQARSIADPSYNFQNTSWIKRLHYTDRPFRTKDVIFI